MSLIEFSLGLTTNDQLYTRLCPSYFMRHFNPTSQQFIAIVFKMNNIIFES